MPITTDFLEIIKRIAKIIDLPKIKDIIFPPSPKIKNASAKKSNFGAIVLDDDSVGIVYLDFSAEIKEKGAIMEKSKFIGSNPFKMAMGFSSSDNFQKTIGLGAINAISQHVFKRSSFKFDFTTDSLGLLDLNSQDKVGMVGLFPPLVKQIENMNLPLVVIEKKPQLIKKTKNWEVTLEPKRLEECNKVLCTSTTVLNDSIDDILKYCSNAEKFSMIGPTAGFLPDPLFKRGINVVGSTFIHDVNKFKTLLSQNQRWGPATTKYCIQKEKYSGIDSILNEIH